MWHRLSEKQSRVLVVVMLAIILVGVIVFGFIVNQPTSKTGLPVIVVGAIFLAFLIIVFLFYRRRRV